MLKFAIIVPFLILTTYAVETPITKCSGEVPAPIKLAINNCTIEPCPLIKNQDAVLNLTFKATKYLDELHPKVVATVFGSDVPYSVAEKDACKGLTNTRCPLDENEPSNYIFKMPVAWYYPSISLGLTFSLVDGTGEGVVCFKVKCYVTSG